MQTRILVTHHLNILPDADLVVVMDKGTISETGTFHQLVQRRGHLATHLLNHLKEIDNTYLSLEKGKLIDRTVVILQENES